MLQKLNERIQGVVAWFVVIAVASTFVLFGVDYFFESRHGNQVLSEVNGVAIDAEQFDVTYRRIRQQKDPATLTNLVEKQLKKQVLDDMILNEVSIQSAEKNGFYVSNQEADAAIVNIPQFQQNGDFSEERYRQALSQSFYTPLSFQKQVKQGMLLNQQRFAFMGNSFALPFETERFVKLLMQTRDYRYLIIPSSLFIKEVSVSPDEVSRYYLNHKKDYLSPEQVSIDYVQLSLNDIKSQVKVDDVTVKQYYDNNKGNYLSPEAWQVQHILFSYPENANVNDQKVVEKKADEIYAQLKKSPALFDSFVKTVSDDKLASASKGVLPWIIAGDNTLDPTLMTLKKKGDMSPPVKTAHGIEIFKLVASKPAMIKSFDSVQKQIHQQLVNDMAQQRYMQLLDQLTDLSYQSPDNLTTVSDSLKLPILHTKPFSRQSSDSSLTKNPHVINAAFSHDVLLLGNNSEPIQLDPQTVVVLRVNQHILEKEMALSMVSSAIKNQLAQNKAQKRAEKAGAFILKSLTLNNEDDVNKMMNKYQLNWQEANHMGRDADKGVALINEFAFTLSNVNDDAGTSLVNGDYVVVDLKAINDGQLQKLDNEQQSNLLQQIESSYGIMDYDVYINFLMKEAKIERY